MVSRSLQSKGKMQLHISITYDECRVLEAVSVSKILLMRASARAIYGVP